MVFSGIRWSVMSSNELLTVLKSKFLDAAQMVEIMNVSDESDQRPCHIVRKYIIHLDLSHWHTINM